MTAPVASATPRPAYRRRLHYVDSSVQRSLLIAMVALEVSLVAASIGFTYWRLSQLIDENMYRMHVVQTGPTWVLFAEEGLWVLGLFAAINILALMVAAKIWSHHENLVLRDFTRLIGKSRELDFSGDANTPRQHEVLALAVAWRAQERIRFAAIRDQVSKLEAAMSARESPQGMQIALERLNELLS